MTHNNNVVKSGANPTSRKEQVRLVREPTNRYDRNAIRADNIRDEQVGHIPREAALYLSPMLDQKTLHHVEGVVTSGTQNKYSMPVTLFLYGGGFVALHAALALVHTHPVHAVQIESVVPIA